MNKGRATIPQLIQNTALTPRQLRHGLVVLLQNNLLYYNIEAGHAFYTANIDAAYNIIRIGKILDMIGTVYGEEEREVIQNLLGMGHAKVGDLRDAYQAKFKAARLVPAANGDAQHEDEESTGSKKNSTTGLFVNSLAQLDDVLCRLIQAELVAMVREDLFRSPEDRYKSVEEEIIKTFFSGGIRGSKGKEEYESKMSKRLREMRDEPLSLKRTLHAKISISKRRKVSGWSYVNGTDAAESDLVLEVGLRLIGLGGAKLTFFQARGCPAHQLREVHCGASQPAARSRCVGAIRRDYRRGLCCPAPATEQEDLSMPVESTN